MEMVSPSARGEPISGQHKLSQPLPPLPPSRFFRWRSRRKTPSPLAKELYIFSSQPLFLYLDSFHIMCDRRLFFTVQSLKPMVFYHEHFHLVKLLGEVPLPRIRLNARHHSSRAIKIAF